MNNIFFFPENFNFKFVVVQNKSLIVGFNSQIKIYYLINPGVSLIFNTKNQVTATCFCVKTLKIFCKNFAKWLKSLNTSTLKKLVLKGLGLKATLINNNKVLELKLGFSKLILIDIPNELKIILFKKRIIVEGLNSSIVGNFAFKLRSLKTPNIYKGKGLWYNKEKISLKPVKK